MSETTGPVKLDDWMLGTLQTLGNEQVTARKQIQEWMQIQARSQVNISEFLKLCAIAKGVNLDDYQFDDKTQGFIPKPK